MIMDTTRIKIVFGDITRKLVIRKGFIISDLRKIIGKKAFSFLYVDQDGDRITAASEQEMEDAIFIERITKFEWKGEPSHGEDGSSQSQSPCQSSSPSKVRRLAADDCSEQKDDDLCVGVDECDEEGETPAVSDCSNANAADCRSSSLSTSAITKIKKSLSLFHKEQYGSPLEMEYKKNDGKSFLLCSLCNASLDISLNWRNVKSHFVNVNHQMNFYSVYGRGSSEAVSCCVELEELQAKRFIESEAPKELKLETQNGKVVIQCLVCQPKVIPLAGRPSYKLRVREHLKTAKHREARDRAQWKMRQKSILNFTTGKQTKSNGTNDHK